MGFLGAGVKLVSITDYKPLQSMNPRLETGLQIQQPKSYPYIFDSEEVLSASERLTLLREMSWVLEAEEGWGEKNTFIWTRETGPLIEIKTFQKPGIYFCSQSTEST